MADPHEARTERIQTLLAQLNDVEQRYGRARVDADPQYAPTGEVHARVKVLKVELAKLGVRLRWTGDRYVIEDGHDAGS